MLALFYSSHQGSGMKPDHELDHGVLAVSQTRATKHILEIIRSQTGMRVVGLAWVREDHWRACAVLDDVGMGLKAGDELDVDTTLCKDVMREGKAIVFNDAHADPVLREHPTPKLYNFRAYSSFPVLLYGGRYFGNLFALDPEPRDASSDKSQATFAACANMLGKLIDDEIENQRTQERLRAAEDVGTAREHFLAVVAHDLRNPLQTIKAASALLTRGADPAKVGRRLSASAVRMTRLIDDLVDFTKGRAGSLITVQRTPHADLAESMEAVVDEFRDSHVDREFRSSLQFDGVVVCDVLRLQQLLSNLLGNAVAYGRKDSPVVVEGYRKSERIIVSVANWGDIIPQDTVARMFDPYFQGPASAGTSMGLGLSICTQIAKAHGGTLSVISNAESGTRFELSFPAQADH